MHSLIIGLAFMASFSVKTYAPGSVKIPARVVKAFEDRTNNSVNGIWSETGQLFKVDFTVDNRELFDYFDHEGNFVAESRLISVREIPEILQKRLKEKAAGGAIKEIIELGNEDGMEYYAAIVRGNVEEIYKSYGDKWMLFHGK